MGCTDRKTGLLIGAYELGLLSGEEKRRFEEHLLQCQYCSDSLYRAVPIMQLIREKNLAPEGECVPPEKTDRKRGMALSRTGRWVRFFRHPRVVAAAGALAVLAAVLVALWIFNPGEKKIRLRGGDDVSILVIFPVGEVSVPGELRWKPVAGVKRFTAKIYSSKGFLIWEKTTEALSVSIPESIQKELYPGNEYLWQVEGRTGKNRVLNSQVVRFRIRR